MENKVKRPVSVWIAQGLFVLFVLMVVLAYILATLLTKPTDGTLTGVLVTTILSVAFIALAVIAFWGMAKRKTYGRWLGVGLLSFMIIFAIVGDVLFPSTSAKPMASKVIEILFSIFVFVITLHIVLSDKVAEFFAPKSTSIDA